MYFITVFRYLTNTTANFECDANSNLCTIHPVHFLGIEVLDLNQFIVFKNHLFLIRDGTLKRQLNIK